MGENIDGKFQKYLQIFISESKSDFKDFNQDNKANMTQKIKNKRERTHKRPFEIERVNIPIFNDPIVLDSFMEAMGINK